MLQVKGYVEKIIYTNEENGHTILEVALSSEEVKRLRKEEPDLSTDIEDTIVCIGTLYLINPGEYVVFNGSFTMHPSYGLQVKVTSYEESVPEDMDAVERYLGSGAIKGVGPALAARIVRHFKADTMQVIEERPEELVKIKGISERIAMSIADQIIEKKSMRKAMIFLGELGIGMNLAVKLYKQYDENIYQIIKENPYKLADDMEGVGFKIADSIAMKSGVELNSPYRIKSGILYTMRQAVAAGHTYVPMNILCEKTANMLGTFIDNEEDILMELIMERKIKITDVDGQKGVYLTSMYNTEINIARRLVDLDVHYRVDEKDFEAQLSRIEAAEAIELDELQRNAVKTSVMNGFTVITGGPGTGKTTTINTIIKYFDSQGLEIRLAAPTGRAAKRMTETTGWEAQTIHRLLELSGALEEESKNATFGRNEDNPLEADVIIIDEASMVDVFLMNSLLKAICVGTRLILVGDANQLPSVGPGNVLNDIIAAERFEVVRLTKIFRQAQASDIVVNAHRINQGEYFEIGPASKDFPFIKRPDANSIINAIVTLVKTKLPAYTDCTANEIQVLTPTRKGTLGVERLNVILQQYLNPNEDGCKVEKEIGGIIFREGDKVMQIRNNYQKNWELQGRNGYIIDSGLGIFNGDTGVIDNINLYMSEITVRFDDGKYVVYNFKETDDLEHAYAITVHKSQGSEYPAVVLPLLDGPRPLMNRNILYTAVTRAKKCICVVGSENTFFEMVSNENDQKRYTSLDKRIREIINEK
ncbi:MAG: ATP-dependent RecD-like DNA helicase [Butyrivibrio sp.]|nr:ATP-dependent RecD-like DNA helicase [Butyrivibrio sp.]